jgi:hypothetical protein
MHAADDDLMRNQADREKEFPRHEQMRCIRQHSFDGNRNRQSSLLPCSLMREVNDALQSMTYALLRQG